jgi:hypothetical protein
MGAVTTGISNTGMLAGRYAASFSNSSTKPPLPAPALQHLHKTTLPNYVALIKKHLTLTNPGDLLWLFSQFSQDICDPKEGVNFELSSPSESPTSVYRLLALFCHKPTYQNPPYLAVLLAIAHLHDLSITERMLTSNIIVTALELLTTNTKRTKTVILKVEGKSTRIGYASHTVKAVGQFHDNIIAPFPAPTLGTDIAIIEESEVTIDESDAGQRLGKRKHGDHSDSDSDLYSDFNDNKRSDKMLRDGDGLNGHGGDGGDDDVMLLDE